MENPLRGVYLLTQSWEAHLRNAGPTLGGEDYATPYGTRLPILDGDVEYVTPKTRVRPDWYNTGLGNAVAYRRDDDTRTVYGHLSAIEGRQAYSGNSGTVRPAPTASDPFAGSHVHVHDVAADGVTRLRPFTTATATGGAGGGGITQEEDVTLRIIKNAEDTDPATSRFLWWDDGSLAPRIVSESTASIYRDAGVPENPVERGRWLWLLGQARKDAVARTPSP